MEFSSITFLLYFLPLFLGAYYITPKKFRNLLFLLFSIFFYSWGGPAFILLMIVLCVINYYLVNVLHHQENATTRKRVLWGLITLNIGSLAYFKYANFFIDNVQNINAYFGWNQIGWEKVALPMGISFFTFQSITYIMDVYQRKHAPEKKLTDFMLFILSFPQMIAGPIVQYNEIADQINGREETVDDFLYGFLRFAVGLGKKVLIANVLAEHVDLILDNYTSANTSEVWIAMIGYSFQIYFDFSGYSDMAVGLGRMVGFHFPENFNHPYISRNISEFWRRWHITLGAWMKNYLYIPLGGNRVTSKTRLYLNLWIVFLISGLWHGASWNFVLWGAFHGVFLVLDRLFLEKWTLKIGHLPSALFTFLIVTIGWVLFRMETFGDAVSIYQKMFAFEFAEFVLPTSFITVICIAFFFALLRVIPGTKSLEQFIFNARFDSTLKVGVYSILIVSLLLLGIAFIAANGVNPFIYTRF